MASIFGNRVLELMSARLPATVCPSRVPVQSVSSLTAGTGVSKCTSLHTLQQEGRERRWRGGNFFGKQLIVRSGLYFQIFSSQLEGRIHCWSLVSVGTPHLISPLAMTASPSVVVTREQGKNGKLINALNSCGLSCLELPLIEHRKGPDRDLLPRLLHEENFEWIIITSPEAASVFLEGWREAGNPPVRLAVVGSGTGQMFEGCPKEIEIAFTPSKATAKVLSSEIPHVEGGSKKVLYPASAKAGSDLETGLLERGFLVTRISTYSTETVESVDFELMETAAAIPVVTFASPSAVRAWIELVAKKSKWNGAAACIGSTSAEAARKAGLTKVFYPDSPGIDGWVSSVMEALQEETNFVSSSK